MKAIFLLVILYSTQIFGVHKGFGPGEQDYGHVTVRQGAHMFWWLYHTTANVTDSSERPLILWLVGGPGGSSCGSGNFMLVGPLDEKLNEREDNWVKDFNILFVDSPVGGGFSYVENHRFLNDNDLEVAEDLVKLIEGFYDSLPKFKTTPFYVFGIGYGGKIAVEFVRLLSNEIKENKIESNIKAVSSIGPWISPVDYVTTMANYLYQVSMVDEVGQNIIRNESDYIKDMCDNGNYLQCSLAWYELINIINDVTDGIDISNIINKVPKSSLQKSNMLGVNKLALKKNSVIEKDVIDLYYLMNGPVKQALNISDDIVWLPLNVDIVNNLLLDFMVPVTSSVESILNNTNIEVHISNGNLDAVASTPGQVAWINKLNWKNDQDYKNAPRTTMWVNNTMEGYYKRGGGLSFYWLNVAGEVTILDNPVGTREFLKLMTGY